MRAPATRLKIAVTTLQQLFTSSPLGVAVANGVLLEEAVQFLVGNGVGLSSQSEQQQQKKEGTA